MKISPDDQRSYNNCPHSPEIQRSLDHILNLSCHLAKLFGIDFVPPYFQLPRPAKIVEIARIVFHTFGPI